MHTTNQLQSCKSCGQKGTGKYCSNCGQTYDIKRISLKNLLHDVFHFFTHLEKGFGYTLKQLIIAPGTMQREYVEGKRSRYQKPFSMFFICASINALSRYWIDNWLIRYYHITGIAGEASLFHEYWVLLYTLLIPVITLFAWLLFIKAKYNYAEAGVFQLYTFAFIFLGVIPISLLRFIWHELDTAYIELPGLTIYSVIAFMRFYNTSNRVLTFIKSLLVIAFIFLVSQKMEDAVIALIRHK